MSRVGRQIYKLERNNGDHDLEGKSELDSHADTCAAGSNMIMLERPEEVLRHVDVSPFSEEYEPIKQVPITTCATAWTDDCGITFILIFGNTLFFGDRLRNSLICPNQIRSCNSNTVEDTPRQFDSKSNHGIRLDDGDTVIFIPLHMDGAISFMDTRKPTTTELEHCTHIEITSRAELWDPHSDHFKEAEIALKPREFNIGAVIVPEDLKKDVAASISDGDTYLGDSDTDDSEYGDTPLTDVARFEYLKSISTSHNLSACAIADDNKLAHRLLGSYPVEISGDDSNSVDNDNFKEPNLTINALQTPLYERAYTDGNGHSELKTGTKEVVCLSAVYKGLTAEEKEENKQLAKIRKKKRRFQVEPFDDAAGLEERSVKRRTEFGPGRLIDGTASEVTADSIAKKFRIGPKRAKQTMRVTTQRGERKLTRALDKKLKTQKWRNRRVIKGKMYTDTMHFKVKSIRRQEKVAQVFTNGVGFDEFYPCLTESTCHDGLMQLVNEVGIPEQIVSDGAKAQGSHTTYNTHWERIRKEYHIKQTWIQPHCWWQNGAERVIGEFRKDIRFWTSHKASPKRLWAFLGELIAGIRQRTSSNAPSAMGRTGFELVHGFTPDITLYITHEWYDLVFWYDLQDKTEKLGRWLGPCGETFGGGDCHYILHDTGMVHVTNTTRAITKVEWNAPGMILRLEEHTKKINEKLGDTVKPEDELCLGEIPEAPEDLFETDFGDDDVQMVEPEASAPDADDFGELGYDEYLHTRVMMQVGDERLQCTVKNRVKDLNGKPIGERNQNPLLDTRSYELELPDGSIEVYNANQVAENLLSCVDDYGHMFKYMDEILGHRKDEKVAIKKENGTFQTKTGQTRKKATTKGWEFNVSWKDGSTSWLKLSDMKESFNVDTADYAKKAGIIDEPAFSWWAHRTLKKRAVIIRSVKTKYWEKSYKYGVRMPKTIEEAKRLDAETGTNYWLKAKVKEMKNNMVAFEFRDDDIVPVGHEEIGAHMIFDVKISLERKARLVANGHQVDELPREMTYSSVPSRDSVRLFFLVAALNDLDILSADIQNAYLSAPIKEKYFIYARAEDGFPPQYVGRPAKIVRALYGLPVAGASFRSYLAKHIKSLGFAPCKADPDVYMRPAVHTNGDCYYEYLICYVDDILVCSERPDIVMKAIEGRFKLKDGTIEVPTFYLGADISQTFIESTDDPTKIRWSMSSTKYTGKAIEAVEHELATNEYGFTYLPKRVKTPLTADYRPEIDGTEELNQTRQNYYQGLIGILRWICELGRLDIIMPVSLMSRYLAQAREGHLNQVFHIFAYLKNFNRSKIVFDDTLPAIDETRFTKCDWSEFYPDAEEKLPPDMPEPRGKSVVTTCFVDADHAGCKATRRSHSGIIIFVNRAPILWYSKRQTTVETSTFGSEIVAMRIAIELVEGLRYKLRMMGIKIEAPTTVLCDNESAVKNTSRPESPIKKKHNSIAYHKAREAVAAGTIRIIKEDTATNVADLLTKLFNGEQLKRLTSFCMWRDGTFEKKAVEKVE